MIVQRNDVNIKRAWQLLISETEQRAPGGPITVQVEENGIYHVAIFPRIMESGVVHSTLAFSVELTTAEAEVVEPRPG